MSRMYKTNWICQTSLSEKPVSADFWRRLIALMADTLIVSLIISTANVNPPTDPIWKAVDCNHKTNGTQNLAPLIILDWERKKIFCVFILISKETHELTFKLKKGEKNDNIDKKLLCLHIMFNQEYVSLELYLILYKLLAINS